MMLEITAGLVFVEMAKSEKDHQRQIHVFWQFLYRVTY